MIILMCISFPLFAVKMEKSLPDCLWKMSDLAQVGCSYGCYLVAIQVCTQSKIINNMVKVEIIFLKIDDFRYQNYPLCWKINFFNFLLPVGKFVGKVCEKLLESEILIRAEKAILPAYR